MDDFSDLLFRGVALLVVLWFIWMLIGPELLEDATNLGLLGKQVINSDASFGEYPAWLQAVVGLVGGFALVLLGLITWFVLRKRFGG